ncbi:MAG: hypothetical protein ABIS45_04665 [Burkholderiales bacterium]
MFSTATLWLYRPSRMVPPEGGAVPAAERHAPDAAPSPPGVLDELTGALSSARAAFANFLDLITLEARRASLAFVWMIIAGLVAVVCVVAAWLGIMVALGMWAVSLGVHPLAAVIVIALLNALAAAVLANTCIGHSRSLLFPATRRQVAGKTPVRPTVV